MEIIRSDKGVLHLRGELHISEIEKLRSVLWSELIAKPTLRLEVCEVSGCDTASLQLLCSLQKSAHRNGKQFRMAAPSAAMREASATLGLPLEEVTSGSPLGQP